MGSWSLVPNLYGNCNNAKELDKSILNFYNNYCIIYFFALLYNSDSIYNRGSGYKVDKEILNILTRIEGKVDNVDKRVDALDKKVDALDKRVDALDKKVDVLDKKVDTIDKRVSHIELTLEHEIKPDIQLLAEGHKTLMDNIERSSKATSTVEINEYRISLLERDLKKLKKEYNMN